MCIPDSNPINEVLRQTELHMDNLEELLPGFPERLSEDLIKRLQSAEDSYEAAHNYLVRAT